MDCGGQSGKSFRPVITLSLMERFRSRDDEAFADRLLAVMRNKFGGMK
jgi:6-phosphogluconate dehydrogenase